MAEDSKESDKANEPQRESSAPSEKRPKPPARDYSVEAAVESSQAERSDIPEYASVKKDRKSGSFPSRPEFVYKPDHSEAKMSCLRSILLIINLFIWVLGAVMTALGIWIKVDPDFLDIQSHLDLKQFGAASTVLIIAGVVIMIIGFIGCHGVLAAKMCSLIIVLGAVMTALGIWIKVDPDFLDIQSHPVPLYKPRLYIGLTIFTIIIAIIILLEIAIMAIVWTAVSNKNFQEDVRLKTTVAMKGMMEDAEKRYFFDFLQTKLICCGVSGPEDYSTDKTNPKPIPNSCYGRDSGQPFKDGCYDKVISYLRSKAAAVGGIAAAVFLLQIGILIFTIFFMCAMKTSNVIL